MCLTNNGERSELKTIENKIVCQRCGPNQAVIRDVAGRIMIECSRCQISVIEQTINQAVESWDALLFEKF